MKPTFTTHVIRSLFNELEENHTGSLPRVPDNLALSLPFPVVNGNPNFAIDYLVYNILRKYEPPVESYDISIPMRNALTKWVDSEYRCRAINKLGCVVSNLRVNSYVLDEVLRLTRANLSYLLSDEWPDFSSVDVSSGATSTSRRKYCNGAAKLSGMPDPDSNLSHNLSCVKEAKDYLSYFSDEFPLLRKYFFAQTDKILEASECVTTEAFVSRLTEANTPAVLSYVPKNIKEVRLIVKSGGGTVMIQKCFGSTISRALQTKWGIDLRDQTNNQRQARNGSVDGYMATIDLSSASDNIACRVVAGLFPRRWVSYFAATRDQHVQSSKGRTHELQKIAGMGNGWIFELQTALYHAVALAVCKVKNVSTSGVFTYGDDITIPSSCVDTLIDVFDHLGFIVNEDKSFWGSSPFRESCGGHYIGGVDVTPFFVKKNLDDDGDVYHLINDINDWSNRTGYTLTKTLSILRTFLSKRHTFVSSNQGERTGERNDEMMKMKYSKSLQKSVYGFKVFRPKFRDIRERFPDKTILVGALLSLERPNVVVDFRELNHWAFRGLPPLLEYIPYDVNETDVERYRFA